MTTNQTTLTPNLQHYLTLDYTVLLIHEPDGSWGALYVELPGCVGAGATPQEALTMLEDAKVSWLEAGLTHQDPIPLPLPDPHQWITEHRPMYLEG
jgi:predicted RNase H-like HicB family nuclease